MEATAVLREGDRVVVTGDTAKAGHYFTAGTVGKVVSITSRSKGVYAKVEADGSGTMWWVYQTDLEFAETDVACRCCGVK